MESLDNIIESINSFDTSIINNTNNSEIFTKLSMIVSICQNKILMCAEQLDKDNCTTPITVSNEFNNEEDIKAINKLKELARQREEDDKKKKKTVRKKTDDKTTTKKPRKTVKKKIDFDDNEEDEE